MGLFARAGIVLSTLSILLALGAPTASARAKRAIQKGSRVNLVKFGSRKQLKKYVRSLMPEQERRTYNKPTDSPDPMPSPPKEKTASKDAGGMAAGVGAGDSITNTQEAGVDEGGIIKAHGKHLVVLRRGRLFTIKLGDK